MIGSGTLQNIAFVCEKRFDRELVQLLGITPRLDEFTCGVEWIISRQRDAGMLVSEEPLHIYGLVRALPGYPDIVVYYAVDGAYIRFLSIKLIGEEE